MLSKWPKKLEEHLISLFNRRRRHSNNKMHFMKVQMSLAQELILQEEEPRQEKSLKVTFSIQHLVKLQGQMQNRKRTSLHCNMVDRILCLIQLLLWILWMQKSQ